MMAEGGTGKWAVTGTAPLTAMDTLVQLSDVTKQYDDHESPAVAHVTMNVGHGRRREEEAPGGGAVLPPRRWRRLVVHRCHVQVDGPV
jgi:hypothetical protein